ncbi:MAG: type VI secretion system ATPase TssH [Candidatus Latescibacteria bacterium]|nr:type VI secretion system ATPase TssH [Candidatus Latescibacterota bacterium]
MVTVDMKELLLRLNAYCTNALQSSAGLCVSRTHYEVTVEHFFLKILEDSRSDWSLIFRQFDLDVGRVQKSLEGVLEEHKTGNAAKPVFSPLLLDLIQESWMIASIDMGERKIRSGAILMTFLSKPALFATGRYVDMIKEISRENLAKDFWAITKESIETKTAEKDTAAAAHGSEKGEGSFLSRFCNDFTQKAMDGKIDPVFGRDSEIRQIIDILARRRKNNPICVGEPGVGKTAVIEGLALRIIEGDVPDILQNVSLIELDMGLLEAGAGMKGEFENRLKGVISEVKSSEKPIIMFIDEAHTLIGAGGSAGGGDAANLLKPALARGELRTVAATTWKEYKKYFEKDPALARRFQPVKLDEPSVETAALILRGIKPGYESSHKVIIRDDAITTAAELADRYITGRFLPDKAIDLLDTSCARIKINLVSKPPVLENKERIVQAAEREKKGMERDKTNGLNIDEEKYMEIIKTIEKVSKEAEKIRERWQKEKDAAAKVIEIRDRLQEIGEKDGDKKKELKKELEKADKELIKLQGDEPLIQIEVNPDVVAQVVSDWTGIPMGKVLKDEAKTIINLADQLKDRVKGQDHAVNAMTEVIKAAKAGIKNPDQPLGVFLLAGPSGVGKTEVSISLADILFGSDKNAVTINMSEFQEAHSVSRLVGSPPGYVGYGEGGMLTEAVRQKPYSVVILDECEKAHLDVMNLFYQVFDKGTLTDSEGKDVNFKNTIIILTSNLASDIIQEMTNADERPPVDVITSAIRPVLSNHFKPALLGRMTVIPFFSLDKEAMKTIVELKLGKVRKTLMENNKMTLNYTKAVIDQIAARCTEVETGARNIEYILNGNILPHMAQEILTHMTEDEMPSQVNLGVDKKGEFTIEFKN